jgi:hypothetical protein
MVSCETSDRTPRPLQPDYLLTSFFRNRLAGGAALLELVERSLRAGEQLLIALLADGLLAVCVIATCLSPGVLLAASVFGHDRAVIAGVELGHDRPVCTGAVDLDYEPGVAIEHAEGAPDVAGARSELLDAAASTEEARVLPRNVVAEVPSPSDRG